MMQRKEGVKDCLRFTHPLDDLSLGAVVSRMNRGAGGKSLLQPLGHSMRQTLTCCGFD